MRILTCFHITADLEQLSEEEWAAGSKAGRIDTSYIKKTISCFDEGALEMACRLSDSLREAGETCSLAAVTAGSMEADSYLKTLAALGFEQIYRIDTEGRSPETMTSEWAAGILSEWISRQAPFDLILTGQRSGDGNQGKIPLLLAEASGIPCITHVCDFHPAENGGITVRWERDDGICETRLDSPAVLAVENAVGAYLRVPTLRQRLSAGSIVPEVICRQDASPLPDEPASVSLRRLLPVTEKRDAVMADGSDPEEAARQMAQYYRKWING